MVKIIDICNYSSFYHIQYNTLHIISFLKRYCKCIIILNLILLSLQSFRMYIEVINMYEDDFPPRLLQLRLNKGVSARDMSLSIGQNPGYIHSIESGKSLPSMSTFFFICDYFNITPQEFFDLDSATPNTLRSINDDLKKLDPDTLNHLTAIINKLKTNNS